MSDLSNNPFIDHTSSVVSRFPNIDAVSSSPSPSTLQYSASWQQQQQQQQQPSYQSSGFIGTNPTGYSPQYYQQQTQWPQQPQQQQQYQAQLQTPYSPTNYQSSSSPSPFGQQFAAQVNPSATGYPQSQMQAQYTGYPSQQAASYGYQHQHQQQQQQQQPQLQQSSYGYPPQQQHQQHVLAQFDPYANLGHQLLSPTGGGAAAAAGVVGPGASGPPPGVQHPRAFIQAHKAELEAWDPSTWKQVQNSFDSLKAAWETRKGAAEAQVRAFGGTVGAPATGFFGGNMGPYGGGGTYQTPQAQEIDRLNALAKEADSNIDVIAAGALQMSEVFGGYRHSGDIASKRRVRESCNAALTGLPEYPPATL